jgi:hypothetical protein
MKSRFYYFLFVCLLSVGCFSGSRNSAGKNVLAASSLQPYGRSKMNMEKLELISSGVHFGFSFEGRECQVAVSLANPALHSYIQYELDGVYQKRIRVEGSSHDPVVLTAPTEGSHTLWIYKATEAATGPVFIEKISGKNLKPLPQPEKSLIEFIGNSITCGAAADASDVPCGKGEYHDQHNAYYAYGPRVARALGTEFILSSVSGIGIYRNWNSDGPVMPEVYEKVDFQNQNEQRWDFNLYHPRVVSVALGTNDFSGGDGKKTRLPFDSSKFVNGYIDFVKLVRGKYPDAQIVLLSSAMVNGDRRNLLQNCLTAVKANIDPAFPSSKPLGLYFFQPMQARGCSGHPSVEDHAILAEELIPFFRQYIKKD